MSSLTLKTLALVCMLLDHVGCFVFPDIYWLRLIGRLALPLYCFLLAEGFFHTRSRAKYLAGLALFALLSEIPFDLARQGMFFSPDLQNIFFSLALGFCAIWGFDRLWNQQFLPYRILAPCPVLLCGAAAYLLQTDYAHWSVICIFLFYAAAALSRKEAAPDYVRPLFAALAGLILTLAYPGSSRQWFGILACIPIALYNGKPGIKLHPALKYAFYAFYPLHLLALALLT